MAYGQDESFGVGRIDETLVVSGLGYEEPVMDTGARVRWAALLLLLAGVAAAMVLQLWLQFHWVVNESDRCDYPDDCLGTFYPHVQPILRRAWALGAVASWATACLLYLGARGRVAPTLVGAIGSTLWFLGTPYSPTHHNYGWLTDSSPSPSLVLLYWFALLVLAMSAFLWLAQLWRLASTGPRGARSPAPLAGGRSHARR